MNKEKEFKHFCDNPKCPNHNLELNDEKHYHDEIGSICGILKTHPYYIKKVIPIMDSKGFIFSSCSHKVIEKTFYFCDICHGAIQFKEINYDQFNN